MKQEHRLQHNSCYSIFLNFVAVPFVPRGPVCIVVVGVAAPGVDEVALVAVEVVLHLVEGISGFGSIDVGPTPLSALPCLHLGDLPHGGLDDFLVFVHAHAALEPQQHATVVMLRPRPEVLDPVEVGPVSEVEDEVDAVSSCSIPDELRLVDGGVVEVDSELGIVYDGTQLQEEITEVLGLEGAADLVVAHCQPSNRADGRVDSNVWARPVPLRNSQRLSHRSPGTHVVVPVVEAAGVDLEHGHHLGFAVVQLRPDRLDLLLLLHLEHELLRTQVALHLLLGDPVAAVGLPQAPAVQVGGELEVEVLRSLTQG